MVPAFHRRHILALSATGRMGGPDSSPAVAENGRCVSIYHHAKHSVCQGESPAPASIAALAIQTMSVTLGLNLAQVGNPEASDALIAAWQESGAWRTYLLCL